MQSRKPTARLAGALFWVAGLGAPFSLVYVPGKVTVQGVREAPLEDGAHGLAPTAAAEPAREEDRPSVRRRPILVAADTTRAIGPDGRQRS